MKVDKALYISQEINPYISENPKSLYCRKLPQGIQELGAEVRTFMPKYNCINERRNQLHEVIRLSGLNIIIDDTDHPLIIKVATLQPSRLQVYFIDNDDYFRQPNGSTPDFDSNDADTDERIIFFALGVVETVRKLRWFPSIIQCSGWITSLNPLFIRTLYPDDPAFKNAKIIYALMDDAFEGTLSPAMVNKVKRDNISDRALESINAELIDYLALNKIAIDHSDAIVATSENILPELIEYAKSTGKPFLEFPGEDNVEAYSQFYNSL